jgi:serine/threonine protein kinase
MEQLGRYRIEARIGEGAMADVYRAHDPDIGRVVAIKALKPDYRRDPELGARFLREARAAGALNHPNIATIYDVGEADGVPYIAMELIEGLPLDTVLQAQGRMPFERVLALGRSSATRWAMPMRRASCTAT